MRSSMPVGLKVAQLIGAGNFQLIYRESIHCQSRHSDRYPPPGIDMGPLSFAPAKDGEPFMGVCFFNLPILYVIPYHRGYNETTVSTPCQVLARRGPPKVGENILPPGISDLVNDEFCRVEFRGRDCDREQEPCRGGGPGGPAC